jgi:hypothetical protein
MKPFMHAQLERFTQRLAELDYLLYQEDISEGHDAIHGTFKRTCGGERHCIALGTLSKLPNPKASRLKKWWRSFKESQREP